MRRSNGFQQIGYALGTAVAFKTHGGPEFHSCPKPFYPQQGLGHGQAVSAIRGRRLVAHLLYRQGQFRRTGDRRL